MKQIERYLSAYVVDCMFGHGPDTIQSAEIYQTLRESGSKTDHPVLSKVLDFVRQGDPENPQVKAEVRNYVLAMAKGGSWQEPVSEYKATFSVKGEYIIFTVTTGTELVSVGVSRREDQDKAFNEIRTLYPGITITQI